MGTSTADLKTGSPTITIVKGLATLSAAQTNDIGVGDVIDHDTDNKLVYISAVVSASEFWVQNATGDRPTDVAGVTVNSIKRAFNSISSAVTDSSNASHLNDTDLTAAGADRSLTWVCYDDTAFDVSATTTITGYTVDASHFITLTVAGASQVATGNSQRHSGVAGTGTRMEVTAGTVNDTLDVDVPFTRIEWLEIDGNDNATVGGVLLQGNADSASVRNLIIHNITSDGMNVDVGADNVEVRNSIVYDYGGDGVHVSGSNATIANCTFYLGQTNPASNSVQTDTGVSATASVYNVLAVGPETDFFENTAGGLSLYNCITTDASAGTYDVSGSFKTGVAAAAEFVSLSGTIDLHLRSGADAIDFGMDLSSSFSDDIDDQPRPFGSGWEVGADETPYPSATTNYRSIGTAGTYGAGTVNVRNLSDSMAGVGTAWLSNNRGRGDVITIPCPDPPTCTGGIDYTILAVNSNTRLQLTEAYAGATGPETYLIDRQFTTLQGWEDCISGAGGCTYFPVVGGNLVTDDRGEFGIAYKESAFTSAGAVPIVRFDGSTTDAFHDITLTADGVNRHFGIAGGAGNNVVLDMLAELGSNAVRIRDEFVTVEWLEITGGAGMDGFEVSSIISPSQVTLRYMLIHDTANGDGMQLRDADLTVDVYNNIIFGVNKAIEFNQEVPTSARILNNTLYDCNEGVFASDGAGCPGCKYDSVLLQNNIAHTFTGPGYYVPSTSSTGFATEESSNNLASDGTGTTHSAAGGGINSVAYASMNFVSATDLHITSGSAAEDQAVDLSSIFRLDVDVGIRSTPWDIGADDILAATAVELVSFEALGLDGAVELSWETGSEIDNLGFQLYRSLSEGGPYERITGSLIPGLGSSPEGASYSYQDSSLTNGVTYYYKLEDVETTGKTEVHGPVYAMPHAGATLNHDEGSPSALITYGDPSASFLQVLKRGRSQVVLELTTGGFYAEPQEDGTVEITIPDFAELGEAGSPSMPVKRTWVEAIAGLEVKLVSVEARGVEAFASLRPSGAALAELVATRDGTVRAFRRRRQAASQQGRLYPSEAARLVSVGFQGEVKKALMELAPLRWDETTG